MDTIFQDTTTTTAISGSANGVSERPARSQRNRNPPKEEGGHQGRNGVESNGSNSNNRKPRRKPKKKPADDTVEDQKGKKQVKDKELTKSEQGNGDATDDDDDDDDDDSCFICTEPIVTYAVSACNHRTCHLCALRLRALYRTKNCVYCNTEQKAIIFTKDPTKPFEAFTKKDIFYVDRKWDIRFEDKMTHQDTLLLLQYNCPEPSCDVACDNWGELKKHTNKEHHLVLCDLCIKNKKIFAHEHTLYTPAQLNKHYKHGDKDLKKDDDTGFKGHPECQFCRQSFYGDDELYVHCRDKHEQCHICVRNGVRHQYYPDYNGLEKHFNRDHFLCQYRECLDKKFIVFDSDLDLKAHEVETHGASGRVDLSFEYGSRHAHSSGSGGRGKNKERVQQRQQEEQQQQQQQQQQKQKQRQEQQTVTSSVSNVLSSENFPSIGSSSSAATSSERTIPGQSKKKGKQPEQTARLQRPKGFGNLTNNEEEFPGLGSRPTRSASDRTARASTPASTVDEETLQRHAAALQKVGRLLNGPMYVETFRKLTKEYRNNSMDVHLYIEKITELCGNDMTKVRAILKQVEELMDLPEKQREIMQGWRNVQADLQSFPALTPVTDASTAGSSKRVLVIKGGSTRVGGTRTTHRSKAGVWDRVANAAKASADTNAPSLPGTPSRTSPRGSPLSSRSNSPMLFPTPQLNRNKTAWGGSAVAATSVSASATGAKKAEDDFPAITHAFPSLPTSGSRQAHPTVLHMRRKNANSAWSASSSERNDSNDEQLPMEEDVSSTDKKKKGKKGKQVLFRVGL